MKIYIVERTWHVSGHNGFEIVGVYSSVENAKKAIIQSEENYPTYRRMEPNKFEYHYYRISERILDDYSIAKESYFINRWHVTKNYIFDTLTGSE